MATKKIGTARAAPKGRGTPLGQPKAGKPVALTVKVNHDVYVRLCTLGATQRRTNQDVLQEAVEQYLDRAKA